MRKSAHVHTPQSTCTISLHEIILIILTYFKNKKLFNCQNILATNQNQFDQIQTICTRKQLQSPNDPWIDIPNIQNKLNLKVNLNRLNIKIKFQSNKNQSQNFNL